MSAAGIDLSTLLSPVSKADFFDRYWEKRHLFVRRRDPHYFETLLSTRDVDARIQFSKLRSSDPGLKIVSSSGPSLMSREVKLRSDGSVDMAGVYKAYDDGFTVVVDALHTRDRAVAGLVARMEAELHHSVGVNLYLTPPNAQGFQPHYDNHDVFILQIEGGKTWNLYKGATQLPLAKDSGSTDVENPGKRIGRVQLEAGDTLYIPRGCVHEAVTGETASLHLTVGMHVTTWSDYLRELLAQAAAADVELRRALPPGHLSAAAIDEKRLRTLLKRIGKRDSAADTTRGLARGFLARGSLAPDGHFDSMNAGLDAQTLVRWRDGAVCFASTDADAATIHFQGNQVSGPIGLAPALRYIAKTPVFRVRDLPGGLSAKSKLVLVKRLVAEGLLTPAHISKGEIDGKKDKKALDGRR